MPVTSVTRESLGAAELGDLMKLCRGCMQVSGDPQPPAPTPYCLCPGGEQARGGGEAWARQGQVPVVPAAPENVRLLLSGLTGALGGVRARGNLGVKNRLDLAVLLFLVP